MNLTKIKELKINNNDTYILEVINQHLIINDNYKGIIILNEQLNIIKKISFNGSFSIYSYLKNFNNNLITFYSANKETLLLISLFEKQAVQIKIADIKENIIPLYSLENKKIILYTYARVFYIINMTTMHIKKTNNQNVQKNHTNFYNLIQDIQQYQYIQQYQEDGFIGKELASDLLVFSNYDNEQLASIQPPVDADYHDVIYHKNVFVFIAEEKIKLINSQTKQSTTLYPPSDNYRFLRARFTCENETDLLFVLISDMTDCRKNILASYKVDIEQHI